MQWTKGKQVEAPGVEPGQGQIARSRLALEIPTKSPELTRLLGFRLFPLASLLLRGNAPVFGHLMGTGGGA